MKRPPGLWVLLSAGVLLLSLQDAFGIRATSLIFGKSATTTTASTTTSTTTTAAPEQSDESTEPDAANATKPTLTGIPQVDYIWDPNLPKELNGYNLSDYPFYERVPEDIDFKCDGLHDGFYASVKHKCQVYHHCLYGTRYDFLCANYTAFDQKTFICHFASEVDCAHSKKFWHRNDALYITTTTSTLRPLVIHTTPPQAIVTPASNYEVAPSIPSVQAPRRSSGMVQRRPIRRRRPQFEYYDDYYDDYYEDRPRSRGRKRPQPRPRPIYEDDYDEDYEEDRYERRGSARRRPYERRGNGRRKNKERTKFEYEDDEDDDYKSNSRRKVSERKRRPSTRRPVIEEYDEDDYEERKNTRSTVKPSKGSIYDRPRLAPRIKPPVPKNEAQRLTYKSAKKPKDSLEEEYYEEYEDIQKKPSKRKPAESKTKLEEEEEYYEDYEDEETSEHSLKASTTTTTTTTEIPDNKQPLIRLVKRPFLPSRGGNPFVARGLQPIGVKSPEVLDEVIEATTKTPADMQEEFQPQPDPRTTKLNPLDIKEEEYDVTLNDALNPTLANLPVRPYDYSFGNFRSRSTSDQTVAPSNVGGQYRDSARIVLPTGGDIAFLVNHGRTTQTQAYYSRY